MPKLQLTVQYAIKSDELPTRRALRKWANAALAQEAEITIRIVDQAESQSLNREFRNKDYPTNVLTFTYHELTDQQLMGDLVLCDPVIRLEAQAQAQQKTVEAHYAHLVVHGVLHLQGYDHQKPEEAAGMELLEAKIMHKLGFADPYQDERG